MDANKWLVVVGLISAVALGVGLVTSLISVGLGWKINNEQKVEIAASNKEAKDAGERAANALRDAGIANEAAGKANERAQTLENQNVELRADLENATADAQARIEAARAEADVKVADARARQDEIALELRERAKELADAQRDAANAQLALRRHLEAVARWQQDRTLVAPLPNKNKIDPGSVWSVSIGYKQGDDEAFRFATHIFRALLQAGWSISDDPYPVPVERTSFALGAPSIRPGVTISVPSGEAGQFRADALAKAFEDSGCPVNWTPAIPSGNPVLVIVGSKPAFPAN